MLNWGILGTSRIGAKVAPILKNSVQQKILGIASRSKERAKAFSEKFELPKYYGSYEDLLNDSEIDAVYITVPNDEHFKWSEAALKSGKHVLCEKPLALCASEVSSLMATAQQEHKVLMEGFMYRHHRQIEVIKELIKIGKIGTLQSIHSSFHYTISETANIRLQKERGGGALRDIGCYSVDLSNCIYSRAPISVFGCAEYGSGVDWSYNAFLNYGSGQSASFSCSFKGLRRNSCEIIGTKGVISLSRPFKGGERETIQIETLEGIEDFVVSNEKDPYLQEFENFHQVVESQEPPLVSLMESLHNIQTIDALILAVEAGEAQNLVRF